MTVKFTLKRIAMNTSYFSFDDLIIKFQYLIEPGKPGLEIFRNTKEAQDKDWQIYGAAHGAVEVKFAEINESVEFQLESKFYLIKYTDLGSYEIIYSRFPDSPVQEDCYSFEIEEIDSLSQQ